MKEFEKSNDVSLKEWFDKLFEINSRLWNLEEAGRLALKVRKTNKERTDVKRDIVEKTGSGFKDSKNYYFS